MAETTGIENTHRLDKTMAKTLLNLSFDSESDTVDSDLISSQGSGSKEIGTVGNSNNPAVNLRLAEGIIERDGGSLTDSINIEPNILTFGNNKITWEFASDLNNSTKGFAVEKISISA
jgi:hypothetical protein